MFLAQERHCFSANLPFPHNTIIKFTNMVVMRTSTFRGPIFSFMVQLPRLRYNSECVVTGSYQNHHRMMQFPLKNVLQAKLIFGKEIKINLLAFYSRLIYNYYNYAVSRNFCFCSWVNLVPLRPLFSEKLSGTWPSNFERSSEIR